MKISSFVQKFCHCKICARFYCTRSNWARRHFVHFYSSFELKHMLWLVYSMCPFMYLFTFSKLSRLVDDGTFFLWKKKLSTSDCKSSLNCDWSENKNDQKCVYNFHGKFLLTFSACSFSHFSQECTLHNE